MAPADVDKIHDAIKGLSEQIASLRVDNASRDAFEKNVKEQCEKHSATLYGNGKAGIVSEVHHLSRTLSFLAGIVTASMAAAGAALVKSFI